jgi:hypothetical protein
MEKNNIQAYITGIVENGEIDKTAIEIFIRE